MDKNKYIILAGSVLASVIIIFALYFNYHSSKQVSTKEMNRGQNNNIDEIPVLEVPKKQMDDIHKRTEKTVQAIHKGLENAKGFKNTHLKSVESSPKSKTLNKKLSFLITINMQTSIKSSDKHAEDVGHDVEKFVSKIMNSKKMKALLKNNSYTIKVFSKDGKKIN
ncbi:DUF4030 domain-containing protein [Scopulibacillus cellulosilyticus]|uniref:DUF4030 domain-containing protein n=1 Tax=Scopulibacillus cellulosilyticus TaxID=2665665 RepID=A0ABW2PUX4_9BACL